MPDFWYIPVLRNFGKSSYSEYDMASCNSWVTIITERLLFALYAGNYSKVAKITTIDLEIRTIGRLARRPLPLIQ